MTEWNSFWLIQENLLTYFFGDILIFSIVAMIVFSIALMKLGLPVEMVLAYLVPIAGGFSVAGYLGATDWLVYLFVLILGIFVGTAINKLW